MDNCKSSPDSIQGCSEDREPAVLWAPVSGHSAPDILNHPCFAAPFSGSSLQLFFSSSATMRPARHIYIGEQYLPMCLRRELMKKPLAILTALFALTFLSAAQTGGASGSAQGGTDQGTGKMHSEHKGGGGGAITGCLT